MYVRDNVDSKTYHQTQTTRGAYTMNTNMKLAGSEQGQGLVVYLAIMAVLAIIIISLAAPVLDKFVAVYLH